MKTRTKKKRQHQRIYELEVKTAKHTQNITKLTNSLEDARKRVAELADAQRKQEAEIDQLKNRGILKKIFRK